MYRGLAPPCRGLGGHAPGPFGPQGPRGARPWHAYSIAVLLTVPSPGCYHMQVLQLAAEAGTENDEVVRGQKWGSVQECLKAACN